jgi:hypothetical protein
LRDRINHQHSAGDFMTNLSRHSLVTLLIMSFATSAAVAATDIKAPTARAASANFQQVAY